MDIMIDSVPDDISAQVAAACTVIERRLSSALPAVHLSGSAVDGGLKPSSDIDLLVTVNAHPNEAVRQALARDLLSVSMRTCTDPTGCLSCTMRSVSGPCTSSGAAERRPCGTREKRISAGPRYPYFSGVASDTPVSVTVTFKM
jgi:predicted nucleotidyltransferase